MTAQRERDTRGCRLEAVRLLEEDHRPPAGRNREPGIICSRRCEWQEQLPASGDGTFPGRGHHAAAEAEQARLKRIENPFPCYLQKGLTPLISCCCLQSIKTSSAVIQ